MKNKMKTGCVSNYCWLVSIPARASTSGRYIHRPLRPNSNYNLECIRKSSLIFFAVSLLIMVTACNNANNNKTIPAVKKDSVVKIPIKKEERITARKAPIINITDTVSIKHFVLCIKDSAASSERIAVKLAAIYGTKLPAIIKKNKLKITGVPMAWYKSQKAPYFFEAGFPVDKKLAKLPPGVTIKQTGTDSVVVAHFYGPYDLTGQAYLALQDWLKDHNKKMIQPAYEMYIDDAKEKDGKLKDPYKVQTDIVFTWR